MARDTRDLRAAVGGLLAFVHTPYTTTGEVDVARLRQHLRYLQDAFSHRPSSYFVCCGSGELWALDLAEYAVLVRAAVEEVGDEVPVFAGVGYGTRLAQQFLRSAEMAGADGVLVFPPYLVAGPQEGLSRHYAALASVTRLGLMVYHRDNATLTPQTVEQLVDRYPHIMGLKDGVGDMNCLAEIRKRLGEGFVLANGMPCAELYAQAYCQAGIRAYSPTGIEFIPELAWVLDHALAHGDAARISQLIEGFYRPYAQLRARVPGYGVALVKAALRLRGRPSGGVRPPLVDPTAADEEELRSLVETGLSLV